MNNSGSNTAEKEKILIFVVTCSKSKARQSIEAKVLEQIAKIAAQNFTFFSFIFFDNNSKFKEHLEIVRDVGNIYYSSENRGLWSALNWILKNESNIYSYRHRYIHLIESDMFVNDLTPLLEIARVLDQIPELHMVRTQEFSVKNSWRFDKKYSYLPFPFHIKRSEVDLRNTTDNSYFKSELIYEDGRICLHISNLNAKLPGLHKTKSLKSVIDSLAKKPSFSEKDFFDIYAKLHNRFGLLDAGIWFSLTDSKNNSKETASWGDKLYLERIGYQDTRYSVITDYQGDEVTHMYRTT